MGSGEPGTESGGSLDPMTIPGEYRDRLGRTTADNTIPQLQRFLQEGGTIVTIGTSTSLG